jgi:hypothetical protein
MLGPEKVLDAIEVSSQELNDQVLSQIRIDPCVGLRLRQAYQYKSRASVRNSL